MEPYKVVNIGFLTKRSIPLGSTERLPKFFDQNQKQAFQTFPCIMIFPKGGVEHLGFLQKKNLATTLWNHRKDVGLLLCTSCLGGWKFMSICNTCLFEVLRFAPRIFCACNGNVATSGRPVFFFQLILCFFCCWVLKLCQISWYRLRMQQFQIGFSIEFWNPLILLRISEWWEHHPDWRIFPSKASHRLGNEVWESQTEIKTTMRPNREKFLWFLLNFWGFCHKHFLKPAGSFFGCPGFILPQCVWCMQLGDYESFQLRDLGLRQQEMCVLFVCFWL